nr:hypothetical protein [Tanacetum cinerariifolium]
MLLKSAEEALLMEKIWMEQHRLGVDEMYWVGNKRYEEEKEEQEEEEDEDDKEVEEGKHGDANVREDATRGQNDDPVTSGIRARLDRGRPKQNRSSCSPKKFLKVLATQWWRERSPGILNSQYDVVWSSKYRIRWKPERVMD